MSLPYTPETLPSEDTVSLSAALDRELRRVSNALVTRLNLDTSREIEKPAPGMVRYYDSTVYDPGEGTGLYLYTGAAWRRLAFADELPP